MRSIAPLWASLETNQTGDDIYVNTSVADQVTFRWAATNTADGSPANFAVTLFSNGSIQFYYGAGNTDLSPTVGISAGNGITYQLLSGYSGQATLTNARSSSTPCSRASSIWGPTASGARAWTRRRPRSPAPAPRPSRPAAFHFLVHPVPGFFQQARQPHRRRFPGGLRTSRSGQQRLRQHQ